MKDQILRKRILRITEKKKYNILSFNINDLVTDFMKVNMELNEIFGRKFEMFWRDIENHAGKKIEGKIIYEADQATHKRVLKTVLSEQLKDIYFGMLFTMAREDYDDPLEDTITFNERNGLFELKNGEEAVDLIFNQMTFPVFMLIEISRGKVENLNKIISEYENKYGLYPKELFKIAFGIQLANKGKRPKITDEDAIILANREGKYYDENMLEDKNGKTSFLLNITKSYSNHHKSKLKKANQ